MELAQFQAVLEQAANAYGKARRKQPIVGHPEITTEQAHVASVCASLAQSFSPRSTRMPVANWKVLPPCF